MRRKRWLVLGVVLLAVLLLAVWGVRQVVPAGLRWRSVEPYYLWSRDLGMFPSPEGTNSVQVVVNDGGAMHSGNHWVWILHSRGFWGQRILAEGYVDLLESNRETFPLRWNTENEISVTFRTGRRTIVQVTQTYMVPP